MNISRSINNFTGGLIGMAFIYSKFKDAFIVDNDFSVLVSSDHCSVNSHSGKIIPKSLLKDIAEYLDYKNYKIEHRDCTYIYNLDYKKNGN